MARVLRLLAGGDAEGHDGRAVRAWVLYDFANSIYPAVVTTTVFAVFYVNTVVGGEGGAGERWWSGAVALSALVVAFSSPILGAIADRAGVRKRFFFAYVAICLVAVSLMSTLQPGMALAGFLLFVVANVGFESANVFYNAYLPDITTPSRFGRVSGLGFAAGYLGSGLGLLIVLPFSRERTELVWPIVAGFFLLFSIPAFRSLPADRSGQMRIGQAARWGLANVRTIAADAWRASETRKFLLAFFFYIDGVLTIIAMAGVIAMGTFGFTLEGVIVLFLVVQTTALLGALATAKPTDALGPKRVLNGVLLMWIAAGVAAYFIQGRTAFFVLAVFAGMGLGAVQSASRALMASLIPSGKEAEMFGFYALCGKSSSVVGPLLFGGAVTLAGGNQRPAILVLTALFVIGFVLLQRVRDPKAGAAPR